MTISEIAKMADVSSAAVSRYLNNGSLSESKRERIEAVIKKTGYVPSSSARAMRTGSRRTIGAIVPNISSESVAKMVSGMIETLESEGYDTILADTDNNTKKELTYVETLIREQAAYDMTEILLKEKCKGFAYLGVTDKDLAAGKSRHDGVNKALKNNGISKKILWK